MTDDKNTKHKSGMMSVIAALGANILVAISKFVGYALSGSAAMLNESIHSVVDCGNQVLLLVGDKKAKQAASAHHPFGQGRAKYFFSTIVAMMLFFGGGALGIMEAAEKLFHPGHSVENMGLVLAILAFGLIIELSSLRVAFKEIAELNTEHLPLFKFLTESRHSEILIIFAEDTCAVIGLLLAIGGTLMSHFTGNPFYDAFSGLLIGVLLCVAAIFLAREFYSLIIGEPATEKDTAVFRKAFEREEISRLINLKTVHLSPKDILLTAKVEIAETHRLQASELINDIERTIRSQFEHYKIYIYIETDTYRVDYDK